MAEKYFISELRKFIKFLLAAPTAWLLSLIVTVIFVEIFSVYYIASYIIGMATATVYGYIIISKWIFKSTSTKKSIMKYLVSLLIISSINVALVKILVDYFGFHYISGIIVITVITLTTKYFVYKHWVFT